PDTGTTNGALPCRFRRNWASSQSRAVTITRYMARRSSSVRPRPPWRLPVPASAFVRVATWAPLLVAGAPPDSTRLRRGDVRCSWPRHAGETGPGDVGGGGGGRPLRPADGG